MAAATPAPTCVCAWARPRGARDGRRRVLATRAQRRGRLCQRRSRTLLILRRRGRCGVAAIIEACSGEASESRQSPHALRWGGGGGATLHARCSGVRASSCLLSPSPTSPTNRGTGPRMAVKKSNVHRCVAVRPCLLWPRPTSPTNRPARGEPSESRPVHRRTPASLRLGRLVRLTALERRGLRERSRSSSAEKAAWKMPSCREGE